MLFYQAGRPAGRRRFSMIVDGLRIDALLNIDGLHGGQKAFIEFLGALVIAWMRCIPP